MVVGPPSVWPDNWKNCAQCLEKEAKTVDEPKNDKIFTSELDLKVQNINIKPLLNTSSITCFKMKMWKKLLWQKGSPKRCHVLGYLFLSKSHNELLKVAQIPNNHPIWSPCLSYFGAIAHA
jgi:hypothetical protein